MVPLFCKMAPTVSSWIVPPVPTALLALPVTKNVPEDPISLRPTGALLLESAAR
jgi:hypothetical protein